jgi:hypothetical protein
MHKIGSFRSLPTLLFIVFAVTLYRYYMLTQAAGVIDLYADEAYYWGWAQHFDFGYYSKPPMVAWLIMLGTSLFGDTFVGIKILSPVVYIFTTLNIYFLEPRLDVLTCEAPRVELTTYGNLHFLNLNAFLLSMESSNHTYTASYRG